MNSQGGLLLPLNIRLMNKSDQAIPDSTAFSAFGISLAELESFIFSTNYHNFSAAAEVLISSITNGRLVNYIIANGDRAHDDNDRTNTIFTNHMRY